MKSVWDIISPVDINHTPGAETKNQQERNRFRASSFMYATPVWAIHSLVIIVVYEWTIARHRDIACLEAESQHFRFLPHGTAKHVSRATLWWTSAVCPF